MLIPPAARNGRVFIIASVLGLVLALWWMQDLFAPLLLATLITSVLLPWVSALCRRGVARWLASVLVTAIAFTLAAGVLWIAGSQLVGAVGQLPEFRANIQSKLNSTRLPWLLHAIEGLQNPVLPLPEPASPAPPSVNPMPVRIVDPVGPLMILRAAAEQTLRPLGIAGLVAVVVLFMLISWDDLRDRLIRLVSHGRITLTTRALDELSRTISVVLRTQLAINTGVGLVIGGGLAALGMPNAVLWGLLVAILRFVPYLGMVLAAILPALTAIAVTEGWSLMAASVGLFVVVEVITGNFIEPYVLGARTHVSTLALLVSAAFWTWLWGIPGLLLSTPITVGLAVVGRHVPQLSFLDVLLGDSPVFPLPQRLYQRLVAMDPSEASRLVHESLAAIGHDRVLEEVLLPVVQQAELDRHSGALEPVRAEGVFTGVHALLQQIGQQAHETQASLPSQGEAALPARPVICLPARTEADAAAAAIASAQIRRAGHIVESLEVSDLGADLAELFARLQPALVCIVALRPYASRHARLRARQIELRVPGVRVVSWMPTAVLPLIDAPEDAAESPPPRAEAGVAERLYRLIELVAEHSHKQQQAAIGVVTTDDGPQRGVVKAEATTQQPAK